MIKGIVFDCFGVIYVDSGVLAFNKFATNPDKQRKEVEAVYYQYDRGQINMDQASSGVAEILGVTVEQWRAALKTFKNRDEELMEFILELRQNYKTGLFTNLGAGRVDAYFSQSEQDEYFDFAVTSGDIGKAKPEKEAFEWVAERLELSPEEIIFVDDRPEYLPGAHEVGMQTIVYKDFRQFKKELEVLLNA